MRGACLLSRLKEQGKYNPLTTRFVIGLAQILVEQGRYDDAEKLIRTGAGNSAHGRYPR